MVRTGWPSWRNGANIAPPDWQLSKRCATGQDFLVSGKWNRRKKECRIDPQGLAPCARRKTTVPAGSRDRLSATSDSKNFGSMEALIDVQQFRLDDFSIQHFLSAGDPATATGCPAGAGKLLEKYILGLSIIHIAVS